MTMKARFIEEVGVCYRRNGTVTMADEPSKIVARWQKTESGTFEVTSVNEGDRGVDVYPRLLANRHVRKWVARSRGWVEGRCP